MGISSKMVYYTNLTFDTPEHYNGGRLKVLVMHTQQLVIIFLGCVFFTQVSDSNGSESPKSAEQADQTVVIKLGNASSNQPKATGSPSKKNKKLISVHVKVPYYNSNGTIIGYMDETVLKWVDC